MVFDLRGIIGRLQRVLFSWNLYKVIFPTVCTSLNTLDLFAFFNFSHFKPIPTSIKAGADVLNRTEPSAKFFRSAFRI